VQTAYLSSTRVLGAVTFVLGIVMVVVTLARGGGPLAIGFVVGVLLALIGAGRVFLAGRIGSRSGRA
jgi:hypothetical protein